MSEAFDSLIDAPGENAIYDRENETLGPLLEELALITNEDIRIFCRAILLRAGDAFWIAPYATQEEDLPPDELQEGGNIIHVKRVFRLAVHLAYAHELDLEELDYLLAAVLLHTVTRVADVDEFGNYMYDVFHPYTVGPFVMACRREDEKNSKAGESTSLWLEEEDIAYILRTIRCQKGIWSIVPETQPIDTAEWIMHQADYIASSMHRVIDGLDVKQWRWINKGE